DYVEIGNLQAEARKQLICRRDRPDAHDSWRNASGCHSEKTCPRSESVFFRGFFGCENHCRGAVVDTGSISRGNRARITECWFQFCESFEACVSTWMLVF